MEPLTFIVLGGALAVHLLAAWLGVYAEGRHLISVKAGKPTRFTEILRHRVFFSFLNEVPILTAVFCTLAPGAAALNSVSSSTRFTILQLGLLLPYFVSCMLRVHQSLRMNNTLNNRERLFAFFSWLRARVTVVGIALAGMAFLESRPTVPSISRTGVNWVPSAVVIILLLALAWVFQPKADKIVKKAMVEIEDSPLKSDICRIAESFGWKDVKPSAYTFRLKGDAKHPEGNRVRFFTYLMTHSSMLSPMSPAIPMFLLQRLSSNAITSYAALQYARAPKPGILRRKISKSFGRAAPNALLWLTVFFVFLILFLTNPNFTGNTVLIIGLIFLILIMALILRNFPRGNSILRGFEAWQSLDRQNNTPGAFIAALAEHQALQQGHTDAELLINTYKCDRRIRKFLARFDDTETARAYELLSDAIRRAVELGALSNEWSVCFEQETPAAAQHVS